VVLVPAVEDHDVPGVAAGAKPAVADQVLAARNRHYFSSSFVFWPGTGRGGAAGQSGAYVNAGLPADTNRPG